MIEAFQFIEEPTLDRIWFDKISQGEITKDTNSFLLEEKVVKQIKNIFRQCPKYYDSFVKSKMFALELLESSLVKNHHKAATRLINSTRN